jgi:4-hydroxy-tetrahydrodipicolinate synthase
MGRAARQLNLSGVFAAAVTPNRPGTLDIDYSALMDQLDFLAGAKVSGICLLGSTGEFLNYSLAERQRAVYLGTRRSRVPVIVGVGHTTLTGALQLAGEAIDAGADGILLMPPCFFRYPQRDIEEFCRIFAQEIGDAVPILLYNVPAYTSPIELPTVKRLLDSGRFAGIKDSSGDPEFLQSLLGLRSEQAFALFVGHDRLAAGALRGGADGVFSGCAAAIPELVVAVAKAGGKAEILNRYLEEFVAKLECFPAPIVIKQALGLRGQKPGEFAIPFDAGRTVELRQFSDWFTAWWPAVLSATRVP